MARIGVLISGGGTNLQAIIDACDSGEIPGEVAIVLSNKDDVYGLQRAKNHHIPAYVTSDAQEKMALLEASKVDLIVLAGYLRKIPVAMIERYPNRIVNVHPSLIPAFAGKGFYGVKVHEAAIARGVKISGATVHLVNEDLDAGPILEQEAVPVLPEDTPETLQERVLKIEHKILVRAIKNLLEGEA